MAATTWSTTCSTATASRPRTGWRCSSALQRLDLHLAPLDGAARSVVRAVAELQRKRPAGEAALGDVDGALAVQVDHQPRAFGGDDISVPLAAGFGHRCDLGVIDDRAGAVAGLVAL